MKNLKKKAVVLTASVALSAMSLAGCGNGSIKNSEVVATVGDSEITAGVANFYARYQQSLIETNYKAMLGDNMWTQKVSGGKTYEESVKESVMNNLQILYILEDHMEDYGIALTEEEQNAIKEAAKKFDENNDLEAKELISADLENVERFLTLATIQTKMQEAMTKDVNTEVSDEEAAQKSMQYVKFAYTKTGEDGKSVDLTDEEKEALKTTAASFLEGAKGASDFAAYATEQGYEASTATFDAESTSPASEVVAAANALGEGEFTEVIETSGGLYVAKVTSLLDREATDKEKESIVSTRKNEAYSELCDSWKKDTKIKVNKDVWGKVDFEKVGITIKQDDSKPYEE